MELIYVVEINDRVAMHAEKTRWVKHSLEALHALPKQMGSGSHVQPNMFSQRLHPLDIFDMHKNYFLPGLYCQSP
jgi:hypothetical protein